MATRGIIKYQLSDTAIQDILATLLSGAYTFWDDIRVASENVRSGVIAPTFEGGFKGDASALCTNFVHTQADEVQFTIQMPHPWKLGSIVYPHVHFSPFAALGAGTYAARFILSYYWGNQLGLFQNVATYQMTANWTGEKQWYHLKAENVAGIDPSSFIDDLSSMLHCRLYRDNTVGNNFAGKLTFLEFDLHYEIDGFGSSQEWIK